MLTDQERGYVRYMLAKKMARTHPYRGKWLTVTEIAEATGLSTRTVERRLAAGTDLDLPRQKRGPAPRKYEFVGRLLTVAEIVAWTGWSKSKVLGRRSGDIILVGNDDMHMTRLLQDDAVLLTFAGRTDTVAGWAARLGITDATLRNRVNRGWTIERALTEPPMRPHARFVFKRNRQIIRRIATTFASMTNTMTGGSSPTFADPLGTGVGRHGTDLEGTSP